MPEDAPLARKFKAQLKPTIKKCSSLTLISAASEGHEGIKVLVTPRQAGRPSMRTRSRPTPHRITRPAEPPKKVAKVFFRLPSTDCTLVGRSRLAAGDRAQPPSEDCASV